jgi:hypothetical protein
LRGDEVAVDHRLGDAGPLGEAAERQRIRSFLADDPPGGLDQLALAILARQPLTARPGRSQGLTCLMYQK